MVRVIDTEVQRISRIFWGSYLFIGMYFLSKAVVSHLTQGSKLTQGQNVAIKKDVKPLVLRP
jgi:hypothetical protein